MCDANRVLSAAVVVFALFITGCPPAEQVGAIEPVPPGTDNTGGGGTDNTGGTTPPTPSGGTGGNTGGPTTANVVANAGADQVVENETLVTLTGTGTTTLGVPLTFAWTQTAGPTVLLADANAATATFVAPATSTSLTFQLQVRAGTESATDDITVVVQAVPNLFVANRGNNSIVRFLARTSLEGNAAPLGTLSGPATLLDDPSSLVFDRIGGILVTNAQSNRVSGFLNALTVTGNVVPERFIGGTATLLNTPQGAAYESTGDLLFVANFDSFPGSVNVYDHVSTPSFNGDVAPARRILSTSIQNARDIELATGGELYVLNSGGQNISVFGDAGTINGTVNASRLITSTEFTDKVLVDMALVSGGHLLVVDSSSHRVLVFNNAATLTDAVTPARVLTIPGAGTLGGIVVDGTGRAYVSDNERNAIYVYNNIVDANGSLAPNRTIIGAATGLSGPGHMLLVTQ